MGGKDIKRSDYFEISGDNVEVTRSYCPKCGEGVFLAQHKDRHSCGKCGYTEFIKSK
jgi:small subunit ribosomal protein S27Ae